MKKSIALMLLVAGMAVAGCGEKKKTPAATTAPPAAGAEKPAEKPAETPAAK